ncbi:MAG: hypothetical protein KA746_09530 [Pyrinomonadaceae bacterium]|nr:hypothetical protein [Pyrinomonadaceae bacterium]
MTTTIPNSNKEPFPKYSFGDWAKSLFALSLWLPNIGSGAKLQFLYTLLEHSPAEPSIPNKIETYEDFRAFAEYILTFLPDFEMFEDYVPEPDWGDIKYFHDGRFLRIFYGGELDSSVDHYYAFEILHTGFHDYYREKLGRSAIADLEMCLSVQHSILDAIEHPAQEAGSIEPGVFEIPTEEFWKSCMDFHESYSPVDEFGSDIVMRFTKDLDAAAPGKMPKPDEFAERLHTGENCFYFFLKRGEKVYPVLPRRFLSVLFDTWGAILKDHIEDIEKTVDHYELVVPWQFIQFVRARLKPDSMFDFACALEADERPHPTVFAIALIARDDLILFHIPMSFLASRRGGNCPLKELDDSFASAEALLSASPVKLGLMGIGKTVQLEPAEAKVTLSPLLIAAIPVATTTSRGFRLPNDFTGEVIHLTELLGIIDEVEDAEELGRFFKYKADSRKDGGMIAPINSNLDLFGSFRDSHNVLVGGATKPTFIMLDPHWGSNFRFASLKKFWAVYPRNVFLEEPRRWKIASVENDGGTVVLESRTQFAYYRLVRSGTAELTVQTPADLLSREQGELADMLMDSLADSFAVYREKVEHLAFAAETEPIMIIFFPASLVTSNPRLKHLLHLVPTDELWKMDASQLKSSQRGVRVVFNDAAVSHRLMDAVDRSVQIEMFIDVLRQIDTFFGDKELDAVIELLESEKSQPNRFRRFGRQKRISFPETSRAIVPQLRDFKLADKEIAQIANANGITPGDYEGKEAKEKIRILTKSLVDVVNARVAQLDISDAIPAFISNVDSLTHKLEEAEARTENSLSQEVDYVREEESEKRKSEYLHLLHEHQYLIEKVVQLQPSGSELLTEDVISELLALVDRLLHMNTVSDHIHYEIFPAGLHISHDFRAIAEHVENISNRMKEWGKEQAQIKLGMIGTDDRVPIGVDMATYMADLDVAFRTDLGFGFNDLISFQAALASWTYDNDAAEHTFYAATADEITEACDERIERFDKPSAGKIIDFLTLDHNKVLMLEGASEPTFDLPVGEHRKRSNRYGLRPLVKIGEKYYWGAHSLDRSCKIWASMTNTHKFPSDIAAPSVAKVLDGYHEKYRKALQSKIVEIVGRFTSDVEPEVSPSSRRFSATDIGDIDVFALMPDRKTILNIESKVIDQAYTSKDIKRVAEKIFGRTTSKGTFEEGYVHRVELRDRFLKDSGRPLTESIWGKVEDDIRVVSIFVTPNSFWWTKFPPINTGVHFVELSLLQDFLSSINQ